MTNGRRFQQRSRESGNVFAMLFAAVALTGVLAAVGMQTLTGPVSTITRVTQRNVADNNLLMNAKIIVNAAVTAVAGGDSDGDGIIEPAEFVPAAVGETPPANGGFLPTDLGLALTDPWGSKYGYCVWDHGTTNTSTNRLTGDNTGTASTQAVIALIAAGPDKTFQTTCSAYSGGPVQVTKSSGSDDLVFKYSYAEAAASSNGLWTINVSDDAKAELKDSSGSAVNVTIDRDTGIGDFLGLTTSVISAKTDETIALDGGLLLDADGASADTCTAAEKGSLRLNTDRDDLELCDGAGGWVEVRTPPGGSAGHVQFNDGAGGFGGDGSLFWDNTGKRLGVGGSPSSYTLDVTGTFGASGNGTIGGTLGVTGATTLASTLDVTGNATFDTDTLFVDASGDKVGIGTTSPNGKLSVQSPADGMGINLSGGWLYLQPSRGSANQGVQLDTDNLPNGSNAFFISTPSGWTGNIIKSNLDGVERFAIRHDGSAWFANPVGIGTASPGYLLDVGGTLHAAGAATLGDTLTVAGNATFDTSTLFVDAAANVVGVGTTSPAAKLDVAGGVKIGADAVCNASKAGMAAWNANQLQVCDGTSFKNISAIDKLDDIGDVDVPTPNNNEILTWDSSSSRWVAKNVNTVGSAIATPGGTDKQVQFNDGGTLAGAAQLYWDKTNDRLGIGTASPAYRFHVQGASAVEEAKFYDGDGTTEIEGQNADATTFMSIYAQHGSNTTRGIFSVDSNTGAGLARASHLYVRGDGNVGIGTTTPQSLLHVAGGIQLGDDTATCPGGSNEKLGTLRFNGGNLQVCKSSGWSGVSSGSGGGSVAFSVRKTSSQSVASGSWVKVAWEAEDFDTNNNFDLAAERFTPTVAGKYQINLTVYSQDVGGYLHAVIYKNRTYYAGNVGSGTTTNRGTTVSAVVDMNGTTDYIEAYAYLYGSGTVTIYGASQNWTHFSGFLIGGGDTLGGLSCASGEIPKWNGSAWECAADGGGSGSGGSTMLPGWPDAITCNITSPGWGQRYFYLHYDGGTAVLYRMDEEAGGGNVGVWFTKSTKTFANYDTNLNTAAGGTAVSNCSGKTIDQLYAAGQAFNFVGGGAGSGSGEISFTANGSATSVPNTTWTDLTGWTQLSETGGDNFNASTGKFTAPVTGTYQFSATAFLNAAAQAVMIQRDGANTSMEQICYSLPSFTTQGAAASCSGTVYLTAGQAVEAIAYQQSGSAVSTLAARTSFSGFLVGGGTDTLAGLSCASGEIPKWNGSAWACAADGGGGGSTTPVTGRAWRSTSYSPAAVTTYYDLPLNGGNADLSGVTHSTSTNPERMTVSTAGKYLVSYGVSSVYNPGGSTNYARLAVNGTPISASDSWNSESNGSYSASLSRSVVVNLNAGDYVTLQVMKNAGTNTFNNGSLSIASIGGGSDTLAGLSCSSGEIPKWNGSAWACAADGDISSTQIAFRAHKSGSNQTVTASTWTKLTINSETFDTNDDFVSDRFTATVAGYYSFYAKAYCSDSATQCVVGFSKNGTIVGQHNSLSSVAQMGQVSDVIYMGVGDYIEAWVWNGGGTTINGTSNLYTMFAGYLIGGSGDTLAGLSCASGEIPKWNGTAWACAADGGGSGSGAGASFLAHKNGTNQTVTANAVQALTWSTETFDTNNNFDTGTGRFTPTVAGKYLATVNVVCNDASSYCQAILRKNGTIVASNYGRTTSTNAAGIGARSTRLNPHSDVFLQSKFNNFQSSSSNEMECRRQGLY